LRATFSTFSLKVSATSLHFGIVPLKKSEAALNFFGEYFTYFVFGLVVGTLITLLIFKYFFQAKMRKLSSEMDGRTKKQQPQNLSHPDELHRNILDDYPGKNLSLHEKEIETLVKLASSLSHDLNNLAGSVMGYASLLKKKLRPDTKEFHYAEIIENSSKQIAQLVKRVLGFSQLDARTMKVLDLNQFVKKVAEEFRSVRGGKYHVTVSEASSPALVHISTDQLNQVLLAVLDNAADSMKDGGIIECTINISEKPKEQKKSDGNPNNLCSIAIKDHGTGMSADVRQRIFEPFFTTKADKKYTGLSLSQVFNIVKQNNGFISVDSSLGVGTKVTLYFPFYREEDVPVSEDRISKNFGLKNIKILVVDDEENVRQLGFDILTEHGFRVVTANDGLDALQKLKENHDIRLVIMDMIMPVMTGKEACIEIKKMEHPPKILISTGFSELSDLKTILGTYAEGLIQKPYSTSELVKAVENLLRNPV